MIRKISIINIKTLFLFLFLCSLNYILIKIYPHSYFGIWLHLIFKNLLQAFTNNDLPARSSPPPGFVNSFTGKESVQCVCCVPGSFPTPTAESISKDKWLIKPKIFIIWLFKESLPTPVLLSPEHELLKRLDYNNKVGEFADI